MHLNLEAPGAFPFTCVQRVFKRGYDAIDHDALLCAKRARVCTPCPSEERENMSPVLGWMTRGHLHGEAHQHNLPVHAINASHQPVGAAMNDHQVGCVPDAGCGGGDGGGGAANGAANGDGMEVEGPVGGGSLCASPQRFQRFPPGQHPPTYYHAATSACAKGVDPQVTCRPTCHVRAARTEDLGESCVARGHPAGRFQIERKCVPAVCCLCCLLKGAGWSYRWRGGAVVR
jgi:hypothetical protein